MKKKHALYLPLIQALLVNAQATEWNENKENISQSIPIFQNYTLEPFIESIEGTFNNALLALINTKNRLESDIELAQDATFLDVEHFYNFQEITSPLDGKMSLYNQTREHAKGYFKKIETQICSIQNILFSCFDKHKKLEHIFDKLKQAGSKLNLLINTLDTDINEKSKNQKSILTFKDTPNDIFWYGKVFENLRYAERDKHTLSFIKKAVEFAKANIEISIESQRKPDETKDDIILYPSQEKADQEPQNEEISIQRVQSIPPVLDEKIPSQKSQDAGSSTVKPSAQSKKRILNSNLATITDEIKKFEKESPKLDEKGKLFINNSFNEKFLSEIKNGKVAFKNLLNALKQNKIPFRIGKNKVVAYNGIDALTVHSPHPKPYIEVPAAITQIKNFLSLNKI